MKILFFSKKHPFLTTLFAFLLGIFLTSTIAIVHADSTTINGCISVLGVLRIPKDGTCTKNETPISWNQQGPAGPQGPQGIQGPPGPTGIPGTSGGNNGFICVNCSYRDLLMRTNSTTLVGYNFDNAQIGSDFQNHDFSNGSFIGAILGGSMTNANFSNTNFTNGHVASANASGVNWSNANLTNVEIYLYDDKQSTTLPNFTNTNFTNAIITNGSNFQGDDLSTAIFTGTIWQDGVTCPDGSTSDGNANPPTCINHLSP